MTGPGRIVVDGGEEYWKLQLAMDKLQRVEWIESLAQPTGWEVMATFTWWQPQSTNPEEALNVARRRYVDWADRSLRGVSRYDAFERNPSRDGYHVHALWADCEGLNRRWSWKLWQGTFGDWRGGRLVRAARARIEPVRSKRDSSAYASKYLCKEDAWFDIKLQWHRLQRMHGYAFGLEREAPGPAPLPVPQHEFPFARDVFNLAADPPVTAVADSPVREDRRQVLMWEEVGFGVWRPARG